MKNQTIKRTIKSFKITVFILSFLLFAKTTVHAQINGLIAESIYLQAQQISGMNYNFILRVESASHKFPAYTAYNDVGLVRLKIKDAAKDSTVMTISLQYRGRSFTQEIKSGPDSMFTIIYSNYVSFPYYTPTGFVLELDTTCCLGMKTINANFSSNKKDTYNLIPNSTNQSLIVKSFIIPNASDSLSLPTFIYTKPEMNFRDSSAYYLMNGKDPNGDSLVYSIVNPQTTGTFEKDKVYILTIDSLTGYLKMQGNNSSLALNLYGSYAVKIEKYKAGQLRGYVVRTFRMYSSAKSQNVNMVSNPAALPGTNGKYVVKLKPNQPYSLVLNIPKPNYLIYPEMNRRTTSLCELSSLISNPCKDSISTDTTTGISTYRLNWSPQASQVRQKPYIYCSRILFFWDKEKISIDASSTELLIEFDVKTNFVGTEELVNKAPSYIPLYPNPNAGYVIVPIESEKEGKAEIKIYDMQGKLVHSHQPENIVAGRTDIGISLNLQSGNYLLIATDGNKLLYKNQMMIE